MIEQILKGKNIRSASKQVVSNKGSAGVDSMTVRELPQCLKSNWKKLCARIRSGQYFAQAILGVEIPKENGKKRLLGIPTVADRLLQQAVHEAISPLFEVEFTESSYGLRPNRNAHQAILQAQKYIHEGCNHIVDIDQVVVSEKKWKALKTELRRITQKSAPLTFDQRIARLKTVHRGWINYFRMASMQSKLKELDGWLRNRLRYCIWKDWKKPERKRKNLIRLGIPYGQVYA